MNRRFLPAGLLAIITIFILNWGCTKLDTTTLGDDLLPVVDNVNTFLDTIEIDAYQGVFSDTTLVRFTEEKILGKITNDPLFGSTDARMYVQFKPGFYPYYIQPAGDTLVGLDSIVLTLAVRSVWGDTTPSTIPQTIQVREIPEHTGGKWDSVYNRLSFGPVDDGIGNIVGSSVVNVRKLKDTIKFNNGKSSSVNNIRIKLTDDFLQKILKTDSAKITRTSAGYINNGFYNDSLFREYLEGFVIESVNQGNALMRISVVDDNSRLELHYRKRRNNVLDTTFTTFNFIETRNPPIFSRAANKIVRGYTGPFFPPPAGEQSEIYIQTTPGTYADLKLPELSIFRDTNRIIHRAQLRVIQIPDPNDNIYTPPNFLYVDLRDSSVALRHKPVYFDLNPGAYYSPENIGGIHFPGQVDYVYYGGYMKKMTDPGGSGKQIAYYDFNITKYIQRMVIENSYVYDMRLFAPYSFSYPQYPTLPEPFGKPMIAYANNLAHGRVKVGGGNAGNYKMTMTVIWSKLKTP